jgi:hypothetical protein
MVVDNLQLLDYEISPLVAVHRPMETNDKQPIP